MMEEVTYVFHIPCLKYVDGQLVNNDYQKCIGYMEQRLAELDVNGFYIIDALGYYKGRKYN